MIEPTLSIRRTVRARTRHRVLIAEDNPALRLLLVGTLARDGYRVTEASNGDDAVALYVAASDDDPFCAIIVDFRMPALDGLQVLRELRSRGPHPPVILMSAFADSELRADAKRLGAAAVFEKPFDTDDLRTALLLLSRETQV
jgi:two-component system response regulator (stage 0 sporulation protein F)